MAGGCLCLCSQVNRLKSMCTIRKKSGSQAGEFNLAKHTQGSAPFMELQVATNPAGRRDHATLSLAVTAAAVTKEWRPPGTFIPGPSAREPVQVTVPLAVSRGRAAGGSGLFQVAAQLYSRAAAAGPGSVRPDNQKAQVYYLM